MSARYPLARAVQLTAACVVVCGTQLLTACDQDVASPEPRQTVSVYEVGNVVLERERQSIFEPFQARPDFPTTMFLAKRATPRAAPHRTSLQ